MGYTVDLEDHDLRCKSQEDATKAAAIVNGDGWISPYRLQVSPWHGPEGHSQECWALSIDEFNGDHWNESAAREVWLKVAPHMADGATIEFRGEAGERWRIRWQDGRVFEEYITDVIWAVNEEIAAPVEEKLS